MATTFENKSSIKPLCPVPIRLLKKAGGVLLSLWHLHLFLFPSSENRGFSLVHNSSGMKTLNQSADEKGSGRLIDLKNLSRICNCVYACADGHIQHHERCGADSGSASTSHKKRKPKPSAVLPHSRLRDGRVSTGGAMLWVHLQTVPISRYQGNLWITRSPPKRHGFIFNQISQLYLS